MKLAANVIDGVYVVNSIPPDVSVYIDESFHDVLKTVEESETIYGIVNDEIKQKIIDDYGIML